MTNLEFEMHGIWGELSSWRDEDGNTWLYVPIWGPVSKDAPHFPVTHGPNPHGSIMAFKLATSPSTHKPTLDPAWISGDFDVPEPVAIANGVIFALSTGENTPANHRAERYLSEGQKLLTDQRAQPEYPQRSSLCARRQNRPGALPERRRHQQLGSLQRIGRCRRPRVRRGP